MNAQKYVPIDVIANFRKIKSLTEDKDLISKVARQCKNLACDETGRMVRPTLKMERKTLLLRDIPSSTPVEEVRAIFDKNCGKVVGIRGDIGDTWYVSFETEEECVDTAMQLVGKTFQGKPIHCRVKSENLLRGYFFHPGQHKDASPSRFRDGPPVNSNGFLNVPFGYVPYPDQSYMIPYSQPWQNNVYPPVDPSQPQQDYSRGRGRRTDTSQPRKGHGPPFQTGPRRKKGYRKQRAGSGDPSTKGATRQLEPQLGPEHFPALPTTKKPPTTAGYTKPFRKYSREQMSEIASEMGRKGIPRPETYPSPQDCLVVRSSANTACQLMEPFPVIYPASPSPFLAAQPHHSSELPPFFDLDTGLPEGLGVLDPSALPDPSVLPFEQIHPEMQYLPNDEPIDVPSQEIDDSTAVQFSSSSQVGAEPVEDIPPTEPDQQPPPIQSAPSTTSPPTATVQTTSKPSPQHGNGNRYYSRTGRGGPRRYAQKYAQKNKFVEKTTTNTPTTPPKTQADIKTNEKKTAAAVVKAAEAAEASKQKPTPPKTQHQGVKSGPQGGSKQGQSAKSGSQGAKGSPRSGRGRGVYKSKNRNRGGAPRFSKTDKAAYKQAGASSSVASSSPASSNSANLPQSPTKLTYADMARRSHPVTYKPSSSATK
jgi:hypothetical protein